MWRFHSRVLVKFHTGVLVDWRFHTGMLVMQMFHIGVLEIWCVCVCVCTGVL